MKPTLLVGDYIVITPIAESPERGDIVVFRHPVQSTDFIKRLIGLPGDRVQMRDGALYINDASVLLEDDGNFDEVYAAQGPMRARRRCENGAVGEGEICTKSHQYETLPGGRRHSILNISDQQSDNTDVFTVPEGQFFFMGDNRDNSFDSRYPQAVGGVGYVPFENLIGRADRVIFSSSGRSMLYFWTWRGDRFFKRLD